MLMLMDMFPLIALIWPVTHGITGAYVSEMYGLPWWWGGVAGVAIGILTSFKISKHSQATITDIAATLFLLLTFLFSSWLGQGVMIALLLISVLPLFRWLLLPLLEQHDQRPG